MHAHPWNRRREPRIVVSVCLDILDWSAISLSCFVYGIRKRFVAYSRTSAWKSEYSSRRSWSAALKFFIGVQYCFWMAMVSGYGRRYRRRVLQLLCATLRTLVQKIQVRALSAANAANTSHRMGGSQREEERDRWPWTDTWHFGRDGRGRDWRRAALVRRVRR